MGRQLRLGGFAALLALGLVACRETPAAGTNLLLVTVDTLRSDRLGFHGHPGARTPVLDAWAARGAVFENATTPAPRTTQALASLLTAAWPHQHGVREVGERLDARALTLAEILRDAGYATAAVSANPVAGPQQGLDQGFETFVDADALWDRHSVWRGPRSAPGSIGLAQAVTREGLGWAEGRPARPFFLWLHYFDPHWRYEPPPPWAELGGEACRRFMARAGGFQPRRAVRGLIHFNLDGGAELARADCERSYDAELAYVDHALGELFDGLREDGALDDTLVVLTTDHGESLGEHGFYFEHGEFVYDVCMRIPLVIAWPGRIEPRRLQSSVSLVDLLPTLLALLELAPPEASSGAGRDLGPLLRGPEDVAAAALDERVMFGESGAGMIPENPHRRWGDRRGRRPHRFVRDDGWLLLQRDGGIGLFEVANDPFLLRNLASEHPERLARLGALLQQMPPRADRMQMARDRHWKLVRIPEPAGVRFELYDLQSDPLETRDVASERPAELARLRGELEAWLAAAPSAAEPSPARDPAEEDAVERQLRALGYVE